jgi:hypothetical protein
VTAVVAASCRLPYDLVTISPYYVNCFVGSAHRLSLCVAKDLIIRNDGVWSSNLSCGTNSGSVGQTAGQGQQTLRHDFFLGVTSINRDRVETGEVWCRAVQSDHPDVSALVVT